MAYKKENKIIPHEQTRNILCGSTSLLPHYGITLRGKELKDLVKQLKDKDLLHIKIFDGTRATEYEISEFIEKEVQKHGRS